VTHIQPFLEADYKALGKLLPTLVKPQRIAMMVQALTGVRFSEFSRRDAKDFDLEAGTLSIKHEPEKGKAVKNKHSVRVIPLPDVVVKELKNFNFKWQTIDVINKKIKLVNKDLSSHSFRHGIIRVNRDLGGDSDAMEVYTGHRLAGMKATYGDGYGLDRLREVAEPCWKQIEAWMFNN